MKNAHRITLGLLATLGVGPAAGQESRIVTPGILIRVTAPAISTTPMVGTLSESGNGGLVLVGSDTNRRSIPLDSVTKIEWSPGRRSQAGRFAKRGALAGFALGAVAGAVVYEDNAGERAAGAAIVGAAGAFWGLIGGAAIGALTHTYDWKEGQVAGRQLSVRPHLVPGRGGSVSLTYRW